MMQIEESKQKIEKKSQNYQREIDLIDSQNTQRVDELKEIKKELDSIDVSEEIKLKENVNEIMIDEIKPRYSFFLGSGAD